VASAALQKRQPQPVLGAALREQHYELLDAGLGADLGDSGSHGARYKLFPQHRRVAWRELRDRRAHDCHVVRKVNCA
jgi:hypothetical protein